MIQGFWPSSTVRRVVGISLFFVQFFLPLSFITFCYSKMYRLLKAKTAPSTESDITAANADVKKARNEVGNAVAAKGPDRNLRARRNILKTLIIVSVCFSLCWSWNAIYYFLINAGLVIHNYRHPYDFFSVIMIYMNCCINPVIYIIHYEQFKRGLKLLKNRFIKTPSSIDQGTSQQTSSHVTEDRLSISVM